jgi:polygalacturonase
MKQLCTLLVAIPLLSPSFLAAQDSRTVSEPALPPICTSVDAQLSVDGRSLAQADEGKLDTARIQHALDACGRAKA